MAGGYAPPLGDQYDVLADAFRKLSERLYELEAPTGTSINSLVAQVQEAIAAIGTTVGAWLDANLATEVAPLIANPGAIAPTTVTASGAGSFGGSLSATGNLSTSGQLLNPDSATYVITGGRLTLWVETATGRHGNTASSRRYKQDEAPANTDPLAVLSIEDRLFHYIAEIRKRDDPTYEDYVGPEYVVADERGFMAEDLHAAGLHAWVIYREVDGEIVPESVDYVMWVVALQAAVRYLHAEQESMQSQVTELVELVTSLTERVAALEQNGNPL